ncbi:MAG: hypothetical protein WBP64_03705 [Nitrososphaeraceae archaeon]
MDNNYTDADANNLICEATGCFEKATNNIPIKVGSLGVITLLLCSNCVPKFQEVEQKW